jgi:hypothetical protein
MLPELRKALAQNDHEIARLQHAFGVMPSGVT